MEHIRGFYRKKNADYLEKMKEYFKMTKKQTKNEVNFNLLL